MNAVVTGAYGFIGGNLVGHLERLGVNVVSIGSQHSVKDLRRGLEIADTIYHLAGVNRPKTDDDFEQGNVNPVVTLCTILRDLGRTPRIVMTSSTHAELDTPYGLSKLHAEQTLSRFYPTARIVRLRNVFGKGCRPNYNGVVATFCYNISRNIPIQISQADRVIELVYVDDVVTALVDSTLDIPFTPITLGDLASRIRAFRGDSPSPQSLLDQQLYDTYRSYREG